LIEISHRKLSPRGIERRRVICIVANFDYTAIIPGSDDDERFAFG
jgi:hypothetical protein